MARAFSRPFDAVVAEVIARLKAEGFGVLTDIDVQATLKAKLGVMLPCNAIVHEMTDNQVDVASVDPVNTTERTGNPALAATARDVRGSLLRALDAIAP